MLDWVQKCASAIGYNTVLEIQMDIPPLQQVKTELF